MEIGETTKDGILMSIHVGDLLQRGTHRVKCGIDVDKAPGQGKTTVFIEFLVVVTF